jgi:hypothetical protein
MWQALRCFTDWYISGKGIELPTEFEILAGAVIGREASDQK